MKKKIVCSALALASVGLLVGCGATAIPLKANWYRDTSVTTAISGTNEKLVYSVTYKKPEKANKTYSVSYQPGTYTLSLINTFYEWEDGKKEEAYRLTADFAIKGTYSMNGTEVPFEDSMTSCVYFRTITGNLEPIYAEKTIHSTSPASMNPTSPSEMCTVYEYATKTYYASDLSSVKVVKTDLKTGKNETTEVSTRSASHLYDNEELLFLGRAMSVFSTQDTLISCVDANSGTLQNIAYSYLGTTTQDITLNGETHKEVNATILGLGVRTAFAGAAQRLTYAQTTSASNNEFRNVLLSMETSLSYQLGNLVYTLETAEFTNK